VFFQKIGKLIDLYLKLMLAIIAHNLHVKKRHLHLIEPVEAPHHILLWKNMVQRLRDLSLDKYRVVLLLKVAGCG
jgi:hypothetical protein